MFTKTDFTQIGKIIKTHSLSGECASSLSIELDDINTENNLFLFLDIDDCLIPFRVSNYRYKTLDNVFISFVDINDKDEANKIVGKTIWIENKYIPDDFGDYFDLSMLIGFKLYDAVSSKCIGDIIRIDESTINTIAEIELENKEIVLVPLVEGLISSIDAKNKYIYYNTPEGLF